MNTPITPPSRSMHDPVRYAVVGAGHISQSAVLPAFEHGKGSELVAVVSGDEVKRAELERRYDIPRVVPYEGYDELLASGDVDAVYIALPNHLHCDYTLRAARHGVHVLCEKPMAIDERECEQMIRATDDAGVMLMIAYRLHFDPANLDAVRRVRAGELGQPRLFTSSFTYQVREGDIRLDEPARGGGPVYDLGIYCINAARYLFREEPTVVTATAGTRRGDSRFEHGPEAVSATLAFDDGRIATFVCGFGSASTSRYTLIGERGTLTMDPAYAYAQSPCFTLELDGERTEHRFPDHDQFAAQLVYFSECIRQGLRPEPDGREGLADIHIVRSIHESLAEGGRPIRLLPVDPGSRPDPAQVIVRPPQTQPPEPVRTSGPRREDGREQERSPR